MRSTVRSVADPVIRLLRDWWPVVAFLVPVLVVQAVWSAQYDVAGHAAGHLGSATAVFPMVFVSAVLLWALPGHGRRDPLLWLFIAAAIGSCLVVMAGNVQVVDAIGEENWTDAQASRLGPARFGFESGHDLASLGAWGAVLATMLGAGMLWRRRLVSAKVAAAAAVLSLVFPHWIAPGFGIVVLVISVVVARFRRLREVRGSGTLVDDNYASSHAAAPMLREIRLHDECRTADSGTTLLWTMATIDRARIACRTLRARTERRDRTTVEGGGVAPGSWTRNHSTTRDPTTSLVGASAILRSPADVRRREPPKPRDPFAGVITTRSRT